MEKQSVLTTINDYVVYEEQYRKLLCRPCKKAVAPGQGVEWHFRRHHKLTGAFLREIVDTYGYQEGIDGIDGAVPDDGQPPIAGLPVYAGSLCTQCRYCTRGRRDMARHWKAARHSASGPRSTSVQLQTWSSGPYTRYWIVGTTQPHDAPASAASGLQHVLAERKKLLDAEDKERLQKGDEKASVDRDSEWVKALRWVHHFGSRKLLDIHAAATYWQAPSDNKGHGRYGGQDTPDNAEERRILQRLGESFDREVERCCGRLDSVPARTLGLLKSIVPFMPGGKLFRMPAMEATVDRYALMGRRFLGFCYRAHQLGRAAAETQWAIRFRDEQWALFVDIVHTVTKLEQGSQARGVDATRRAALGERDVGSATESEGESEAASVASGETETAATAALDRAVFLFLLACIRDRVGGDVYQNPLLGFCAALGIRAQPLGYTEPQMYTSQLAAIVWWCRLFFLEDAFQGEPHDEDELGIDAIDRFDQAHAQWLCKGRHTVVDVIVGWMAYGKECRMQAEGRATMHWSEDRAVLYQNGKGISVHDFQKTMCTLVDDTEQLLTKLFAGQWRDVRRGLVLPRIQDSMVRLGAGQSFATQASNAWLQPGPAKVIEQNGPVLWEARRGRWKTTGIRAWLRRLDLFRRALLTTVHVWGGQPGRGPELMTMRHCDSWQVRRNVYVHGGQVMLVTDRDKMRAMHGRGRKVARFLPERVGRMLLAYILWLLPAERVLLAEGNIQGPRGDQLEYLWRHGASTVWKTDRLSGHLHVVTQAGIGVRMGTARYRPVAIEMGRQIKGLAIRQVEAAAADALDSDDDDGLDVDPLTGEAVPVGGNWNDVWDLQATHGTRVARQHYGVHVAFVGNLQPEMVETFRAISGLWHQFLEKGYEGRAVTETAAAASHEPNATKSRKRSGTASTATAAWQTRKEQHEQRKQERQQQRQTTSHDEVQTGLQALLGPSARWRSAKQEACARRILELQDEQSAICVLPTGAGKSLLFLLPAVLPQAGTSIVVVPFVALLQDVVKRAQDMGVDCIAFQSGLTLTGREQRAARLVVVSADVAAGTAFCTYVEGLVAAGVLRRIFIDECHTVITDVGYRARLGELRSLHRFGQALILLTATLPPSVEGWFRREMLVEDAVVLRDRTTKLNVRYRVEVVRADKGRDRVLRQVTKVVDELAWAMTTGQKGVVYCRSRQQCEAVAEATGCGVYHSGMSDAERQAAREAWIQGKAGRWIAATSGLGTGVDIAGIVAVVHMGRPYGLVDFIQQTGRGGRRLSEEVQSVVVYDGGAGRVEPTEGYVERQNREALQAYLETTGCRRGVIGAFFDGVEGETCKTLDGATWCDQCRGGAQAADTKAINARSTRTKWTAAEKEEGRREQLVRRWMVEVGEACAACHVTWQKYLELDADQKRKWSQCDGAMRCQTVADIAVAAAKKAVVFPDLACCYRCKLPLNWCEERRGGQTNECTAEDVVTPVVLLAMDAGWAGRVLESVSGMDLSDFTEEAVFFRWLGEARRFHGTRGTNALVLWEALLCTAFTVFF